MIMNARTIQIMLRTARRLAIVAIAGGALGGCVIDPPEDNRWDDVSAFSWPTEIGTTMRYKVNTVKDARKVVDTTIAEIKPGRDLLNGRAMYRIHTTTGNNESSSPNDLHFLATRDTLYTTRSLGYENGLKATYALVSPLEPGHTWIAAYADNSDSATVRATLVELYSYWKLEGKSYENVVAVRYEALNPTGPRVEWIRFYAAGVGPILTVKNVYPESDSPFDNPPSELDRATLMDAPEAP
jgi:hypothetical protein